MALDPILGPLNAPQRQAAETLTGPVLILAGAGSGKTRALTHRIAHLIERGVPPWQILAVTFTNKAATEMKERIRSLLHITDPELTGTVSDVAYSRSAKLPAMGTFHSVCIRILRREIERLGRDRSFVVYDSDDQEALMKQVLKDLRIDEANLKPKAALANIGRLKSEAVSPKEAAEDATTDRTEDIVKTYMEYQKALARNNAMDFDDLILETVRLFHECPDVLDRYQETWRFLHVDEYQDTNHAQYLFITLLARKYRNLCAIGDPDQSIYGFRGADVRNILEFQRDYQDAVSITLDQNYRSTQPILTAADTVIAANPNRPDKRMWTERKDGPKILAHEVADERAEAQVALRAVERLLADGVSLREQVILYRTHAQSRLFEEACMRAGIPYRILGGVKFYARREVKDVLAYLHLVHNPYDTVSLLRVINVPSRKIGDRTLERIQQFANDRNLPLWDALRSAGETDIDDGAKARIARFVAIIDLLKESASKKPVGPLTHDLLDAIEFRRWLDDGTEEGAERWKNVLELLSVMRKYENMEPNASLLAFLEEVALVSEVDKLDSGGRDALTMMTIHLCKGLEFEHVMIAGCEEGIFPHSASLFDRAQLEEERRIMYVGMTRAKTHLTILCARSRLLWGERRQNEPSRFLDDLPHEVTERRSDDVLSAFAWASKKAVETGEAHSASTDGLSLEFNQDNPIDDLNQSTLDEGDRIAHPTFGEGIILARRGDVVDIKFDSGQKKTFALSIAPLRRL